MHRLERFRFERSIRFLRQHGATISQHSNWLDLGCNQGQFLRFLITEFSLRPIGADDWAPELKSPDDNGWRYFQAHLSQGLPECGPVDIVSALEVLEHIIDTDAFLKRISDLLKPGGWILISTPNINSLRNRIMVPLGAYPVGLEYRNVIHHVRLYNPAVLRRQLTEIGFRHIAICGVAFLPLSMPLGTSCLSTTLANQFPYLCSNIIAVGRKEN